jgi:succinyl-diaminopimelate desuccinylase
MLSETAIAILQQLIRMRTPQPAGDERDAVIYISSLFPENRVEKRIIRHENNRISLIVTVPGTDQNRGVAILGHLDTIPVGNAKEWAHSPFGAEIIDGLIYGRGAADMKGGVTSIIFAALSLLREDFKPAVDIFFCFTADEEAGGTGALSLVGGGFLDKVEEIIIVKPTNEKIGLAERGAIWLRVKSEGKSTHAAMADAQINALFAFNKIAETIKALFSNEKKHDFLGYTTCLVTSLHAVSDQCSIVPHYVEGTLDIRTLPSVDHDWLFREINACVSCVERECKDVRVSLEVILNRQPVGMDEGAPLVQSLKSIYLDLNIPWETTGLNYFTDASILIPSLGVPFVMFGPGDELFFHQPDEYVRIDSVIRMGEVLTLYAKSRQ